MEGVKDCIYKRIREKGRGSIFFIKDFLDEYDSVSVRVALMSLVDEGQIIRLARGVYCYPKMEGEYAMSYILPSPEVIAESIARSENIRIVEYGERLAFQLGLTRFQLSNLRYLTDGAPRCISLSNQNKIIFTHTSEARIFAFKSERFRNIVIAVRHLGKEAMNDTDKRRRVGELLSEISLQEYNTDIKLVPEWVAQLFDEIRGM